MITTSAVLSDFTNYEISHLTVVYHFCTWSATKPYLNQLVFHYVNVRKNNFVVGTFLVGGLRLFPILSVHTFHADLKVTN